MYTVLTTQTNEQVLNTHTHTQTIALAPALSATYTMIVGSNRLSFPSRKFRHSFPRITAEPPFSSTHSECVCSSGTCQMVSTLSQLLRYTSMQCIEIGGSDHAMRSAVFQPKNCYLFSSESYLAKVHFIFGRESTFHLCMQPLHDIVAHISNPNPCGSFGNVAAERRTREKQISFCCCLVFVCLC